MRWLVEWAVIWSLTPLLALSWYFVYDHYLVFPEAGVPREKHQPSVEKLPISQLFDIKENQTN